MSNPILTMSQNLDEPPWTVSCWMCSSIYAVYPPDMITQGFATRRSAAQASGTKRRDQRKCAVTRSGDPVHHVHTVTAKKMKDILSIPCVTLRLVDLHERRKTYHKPVHNARFAEVSWPAGMECIVSCAFNGVGYLKQQRGCRRPLYGCLLEFGDDVQQRAACSGHSEALRDGACGLGVYTTADMYAGDIVGEYTGELSEYDAGVPGQPPITVK
ncbi:hypothetical protein PHMEG_00039250 [Phytophthora megakarya]|uniref:SET domain-containing protein n=1 Tax=Phytophthora megakarya TaxID=4795 RepID=A0A225UIJ1_9STRA|nr:hypothetical protein PHMEG_00039250 [Phytophthora megakarya]